LLTDDPHIQMLNRDWRGKNKATDVLSFPQVEASDLQELGRAAKSGLKGLPDWWLGDVVISIERAKAQAEAHGHALKDELETLLAHGLLHLLGFDHEKSAGEATRMRKLEERLLGRTMIHH
jgi:rRNA maturation RNase YbeY